MLCAHRGDVLGSVDVETTTRSVVGRMRRTLGATGGAHVVLHHDDATLTFSHACVVAADGSEVERIAGADPRFDVLRVAWERLRPVYGYEIDVDLGGTATPVPRPRGLG